VGLGLFPTDVHSEFDEGLLVTPEQMERASPSPNDGNDFAGDRFLALRFPNGADADAEIARMAEELGPPVSAISSVELPTELTNLRNVRTIPVLLAGFLALLAVAAVGHVLVTSSRRRRHDFAILRALGLNRSGAGWILSTQGTAIGLFGLLVGVPLGIVVGRSGWQWLAGRVPLENVPPFASIAVLLIVPVTVVIVNALAIWPRQRVARIRPAEVLRSE
jgi:ABC-type lipoprotein release transport system permease subunit